MSDQAIQDQINTLQRTVGQQQAKVAAINHLINTTSGPGQLKLFEQRADLNVQIQNNVTQIQQLQTQLTQVNAQQATKDKAVQDQQKAKAAQATAEQKVKQKNADLNAQKAKAKKTVNTTPATNTVSKDTVTNTVSTTTIKQGKTTTTTKPTAKSKPIKQSPNLSLSGNQINFAENTHYCFYCDFIIYIFGVDVSQYVTEGSLSWTYADRNSHNEASFTLQNAEDNFVLTAANLGLNPNTFTSDPNLTSVFRNPNSDALGGNYLYSEQPKKQIVSKKQEINAKVTVANKSVYPLGFRNIVLHKNDPIRIFIKNPTDLTTWINVFTGFLNDISRDKSYITGHSNLKINCYDIRALMKRMRVQKSPLYGWPAWEPINGPESFFADFIKPSHYNHPLATKSYEDSMESMILGEHATMATGVGRYSKGDRYFYNPEGTTGSIQYWNSSIKDTFGKAGKQYVGMSNQNLLKDWYNLCVYGAKRKALTLDEVNYLGKNCVPNGDTAPDAQKMYMMLPQGGTHTHDLVQYHYVTSVEQRDFDDRCNSAKRAMSEWLNL